MEKEYIAVKNWVLSELVDFFSKEVIITLIMNKTLSVSQIEADPKLSNCSTYQVRRLCQLINTAKLDLTRSLNLNYTVMKISHLNNINAFGFKVLEDWAKEKEEEILKFSTQVGEKVRQESCINFTHDLENYQLIEKILSEEQLLKFQELFSHENNTPEVFDRLNRILNQRMAKHCLDKVNLKNLSYSQWRRVKDEEVSLEKIASLL